MGSVRQAVSRALPLWLRPRRTFEPAEVAELAKLDVERCGETPDGIPFVALRGGPTFHAYGPTLTERVKYRSLPAELRRRIPESAIRVARLIPNRYAYPHAAPYLLPPYPLEERKALGTHQEDLIEDIPDASADEKRELARRFEIRPGDVVVEVGAYVGFGTLRLSELVGPEGRVISVEADPVNQGFIQRNLEVNGVTNVRLVRAAIWCDKRRLDLHRSDSDRQQQTLLPDVHTTVLRDTREAPVGVETVTVDEVVAACDVPGVSLICVTVNGAEIEAVQGARETLRRHGPNLTVAGFKLREGQRVYEGVTRVLAEYGYTWRVGRLGRVLAWRPEGGAS